MPEKTSWLQRLRAGLSKSSSKLKSGIGSIFTGAPLDEAMLEELEELLIRADLGVETAAELIGLQGRKVRRKKFNLILSRRTKTHFHQMKKLLMRRNNIQIRLGVKHSLSKQIKSICIEL